MKTANSSHRTSDGLRQVDDDGNEFWSARQLAKVLDYSEYRHFLPVEERAREACRNSEQSIEDHFEDVVEIVDLASGALRPVRPIPPCNATNRSVNDQFDGISQVEDTAYAAVVTLSHRSPPTENSVRVNQLPFLHLALVDVFIDDGT